MLHLRRSHTLLHLGLHLQLVQHGVLLLAEPLEVHAVVRVCERARVPASVCVCELVGAMSVCVCELMSAYESAT